MGAACPLVARVRETVLRHRDLTAVMTSSEQLTYAQLWGRVGQWRERVRARGLPAQSLVAVVSDGQADMPSAFLGVRAAGLVPMLVDGLLPAERSAAVIQAARPAAVIRLAWGEICPAPGPDPRILPEGAGYVVFSSGSQGTPKGIVGQAEGLIHFTDWEIATLGVQPGDRVAGLTSPSFDVVFRDLLLALCSGGELHVAAPRVRATPTAVLPWLSEQGINVLHAVPSLSARWLAASDTKVATLRWTLFAGELLYSQHVTRWRTAAPHGQVVNLYGPSETTLAKFWHKIPDPAVPGLQPVGRPLPDTEFALEPVAAEDYRIVCTTPYGSLGYLPGTCTPQDAYRLCRTEDVTRFETQDRGRIDEDGNLVVLGRLDTLVKRNGVFVDTARIESAAIELPEVRAACCLQLAPSSRIVLAVEGPEPAKASLLRRRLRPKLGIELPDRITAVPSLPLLPGGKIDRQSVRTLLQHEVPSE